MSEPTQYQRFHGVEAGEYWHGLLSGEGKGLKRLNRIFRSIPHAPRCKLCQAPFAGPTAPLFRLIGFRRWALSQQLCNFCLRGIEKVKGGTEVPMSLVFADVRGSTSLAEGMTASAFKVGLDRFFTIAYEAIDSNDGVIDHIVGDGVMALWLPGFVGEEHPDRALAAARRMVAELAVPDIGESFPVGVGVHTGVAYAGVVGQQGSYDFTVLGDVPNTTARLGSAAQGGELAMSDDLARAAKVDTNGLERRILTLKGKTEPFAAWIEPAARGA